MDYVQGFLNEYTYLATGLLIFLENIFPPIPSEIVLISSAIISVKLKLSLVILVFSATLGSLLGALCLYYIGTLFDEQRLIKINQRIKFLGFKDTDIQLSFKYFQTYGSKMIFFGRMVPIIRSIVSLPAGSMQMDLRIFIFYTTLGSLLWNSGLILIGAYFSQYTDMIINLISNSAYVIIIVVVLSVAYLIVSRKIKSLLKK